MPMTTPRRIMRWPEVKAATGYGRTWIYMLEKKGEFPKSRKIGTRSVGWDSQEVESWIAEKLA